MTPHDANSSGSAPGSSRFLPLLLLLFAGSGCAALIYEIVWFQLLELVIGSSAVSLGVLLGTFMGGMCLGSIVLPRLISPRWHPLRVYALLELGIGACGVLIPFAMPYVNELYVTNVGHGFAGILLRGAVCAACLLPPTLLMGATLPAIARWVEATPRHVSWLGFFYGGNIAGAVFGCLLAGFYLLRVFDLMTAAYVAVAINGAVGLLAVGLSAATAHTVPRIKEASPTAEAAAGSWPVYVAIAFSGLCALSAEVIWTRILSLMLGATVYTFSIILAVFLIGLGIGSGIGSALARGTTRPRLLLAVCQLLLVGAIAWTAYLIAESLPYWPIDTQLSHNPWINFQLDLVRCLWAVLPATILWGASFPLALAAVARPGQDSGRLVGGIYAANTAGAIAGALGASLFLIAWAGTQNAQRVLIGLSAGTALLLLVTMIWSLRARFLAKLEREGTVSELVAVVLLLGIIPAPAVFLAWKLPAIPGELVAWGRRMPVEFSRAKVIYVGEGLNSSVAVSQEGSNTRNFHVAGKIEASTYPEDMRLQRQLGHISALVHAKPKKVLVVGCGAGVTAGTFVVHPDLERLVICEIEPLVPQVVAQHFATENHGVLSDPRVEVVHDDARHFVLTTSEKFDIITSDPIHPWVKGAATLYTREYFELCKKHLNPGGVVTQWVPLYESSRDTVRSEVATFFDAFPGGTIWSNLYNGEGYDVVLLGQAEPTTIDVDGFERRLIRDDHAAVAQSLKDVGFNSPMELLATYAGRAADLRPWLEGAEINRDRNLRLQYLAGLGLNNRLEASIYREMLTYRRFPDDLFTGSPSRRVLLQLRLQWPEAKFDPVTDLP